MPLKKKAVEEETMEVSNDTESEDDEDSDDNDEEKVEINEEIQVDFEGRNPIDSDFPGIRQLLNQLFLKSDVNLSELADYIIGQNYIGSVLTQCEDDEDDDEDDDMTDSNVVFGITTAVNLNKSDINCIGQIRSMVDEKAKGNASPEIYQKFKNIFEDTSTTIGFLMNERYVNIPPQIVQPLMDNLMKEVDRAVKKKMPFQFTHYMMILKLYKSQLSKKKRKHSNQSTEYVYSNAEDEVFVKSAILEFEYVAQHENESLDFTGDLIPYRKIIIFEATKLPQILDSIKMFLDVYSLFISLPVRHLFVPPLESNSHSVNVVISPMWYDFVLV